MQLASALGFWGNRYQQAFFDVRVFNPNALTYHKLQLPSAYQRQEREKKRLCEQRVHEIELASFTPLVFSSSGGMSKSTSVAYKRLASLLAEKRDQPYSLVMAGYVAALDSLFSDLLSPVLEDLVHFIKEVSILTHLSLLLVRGRYPSLNNIQILYYYYY